MPCCDLDRQCDYRQGYGRLRPEEHIGAMRTDESVTTVGRARTIGYLAGVFLKAVETGDLAHPLARRGLS